jgi:hypothetical protein
VNNYLNETGIHVFGVFLLLTSNNSNVSHIQPKRRFSDQTHTLKRKM